MDSFVNFFAQYGIDFTVMLKVCGILLIGAVIIIALARLLFGKQSLLNTAVSSAIGILFIYTLQIVLYSLRSPYSAYIPPLPFTSFSGDILSVFSFQGSSYTLICFQILSMIILAFIMNLVDISMPAGKNVLSWFLFRILTILITVVLHNIIVGLFVKFMPQDIITYAPSILLVILGIMLLTGALKLLVGALMATVNPIVGALYTFFFASLIGKQITRAVFTTGILSGAVYFLHSMGVHFITVTPAALTAYIPFALIFVILWYIIRADR